MTYQLIDDKVTSDDGKIGMQHYNSNPRSVTIGNHIYTFSPSHNVSFAWVYPEDVDKLLTLRTRDSGCNCGKKFLFHLASLINTNIHFTGER